ncbi:MAG: hypothetical protein HRT38_12150 [Alteromonadaceae bacterium]|nr:hypothetical protein [Alteromonadaceae bacterium]
MNTTIGWAFIILNNLIWWCLDCASGTSAVDIRFWTRTSYIAEMSHYQTFKY